jgi:hypothetical protein
MAKSGNTDTDMGLNDIFKEMDKLKHMAVKVGIVEGTDSEILEYAAANELGVAGPPVSQWGDPGGWFIPPRPFVKGWADASREKIATTEEKLTGLVLDGKINAETAAKRLGDFGKSGIKTYMGVATNFRPNAQSTKDRKGSDQPLFEHGKLRGAVSYQIVKK